MRDFFRALAAVLRALVPLIEERAYHAKLDRMQRDYELRVAQVLDDPAAAFADFDDQLRAEGRVLEGGGCAEWGSDRPEGWILARDEGVDGASDAG
jgi:hypothetical protein